MRRFRTYSHERDAEHREAVAQLAAKLAHDGYIAAENVGRMTEYGPQGRRIDSD